MLDCQPERRRRVRRIWFVGPMNHREYSMLSTCQGCSAIRSYQSGRIEGNLSTCSPGALLLGVIQADGTVAFLPQQRVVDDFLVKLAHEGRAPEKRFRFADTCVKSGCQQWGNGRCGVIDRILAANSTYPASAELPACSIRSDCRWHLQWGKQACGICPLVITDLRVSQSATENVSQLDATEPVEIPSPRFLQPPRSNNSGR